MCVDWSYIHDRLFGFRFFGVTLSGVVAHPFRLNVLIRLPQHGATKAASTGVAPPFPVDDLIVELFSESQPTQ